VTQKLGSPSANQQDSGIVVHVDVLKRHIGIDQVAGFLDISIPAGIEIVNHRIELFLLGRRNHGLKPRLHKSMLGVENLVTLSRIVGHNKYLLGHKDRGSLPIPFVDPLRQKFLTYFGVTHHRSLQSRKNLQIEQVRIANPCSIAALCSRSTFPMLLDLLFPRLPPTYLSTG